MCWFYNAGTARLSNTVDSRNAGVFPKHLCSQYIAGSIRYNPIIVVSMYTETSLRKSLYPLIADNHLDTRTCDRKFASGEVWMGRN